MPKFNLLEDTQNKMAALPRWVSLSQIAKDTELQVSWISAFAANKIEDPGVKKVQRLFDYLQIIQYEKKPTRICFGEQYRSHPNEGFEGVYIIWSGSVCVYVGTSQNMMHRLCDHKFNEKIVDKNPTHIDLIYVDEYATEQKGEARRNLEKMKIKSLKPLLNKTGV